MRNTITLNGKNSSEITGLLIQTLPPISKPLMRTQIEEIDGRDGDIVTKLGFSAYKKEFTIGLYGDYDVDQVIGYFNSEGTVTFSNEPDKYYYYQIVDQIDFEKLIRFKTATVTMHCQPFKYSTTETPQAFDNADNLVSIPDFNKTTNGITVGVENGVISVNGTGSAATEFYIPITSLSLTAGNYVMRALGSGTSPEACAVRVIYNSPSNANSFGGTYATLLNNTSVTLSATLTENKSYNYIYLYILPNSYLDFTIDLRLTVAEGLVEGEGSFFNLQNTSLALFNKFGVKGDIFQHTYNGQNLYDISDTTTVSRSVSIDSDGWITVTYDNSNGSSNAYQNCFTGLLPLSTSTNYAVAIEVKNNAISGEVLIDATTSHNASQFSNVAEFKSSEITAGATYVKTVTTKSNFSTSVSSLRTAIVYRAGASGSITFRISLLANTSITPATFAYEPYVGGIPAPNPDYPQNVQVATGEQTITVTGKNVFNNNSYSYLDGYFENGGQIVTTTAGRNIVVYLPCMPSTTYSFSSQLVAGLNSRTISSTRELPADGVQTSNSVASGLSATDYTTPANAKYIVIRYQCVVGQSMTNIAGAVFNSFQIEVGDISTSYVSFQSQSYTINLGSTELYKIESYQDYIYKNGEKWYIHKEIGKIDIASTGIGGFNTHSGNHITVNYSDSTIKILPSAAVTVASNRFVGCTLPQAWNGTVLNGVAQATNGHFLVFSLPNSVGTTQAEVRTYFENHPTTVYYALETPTDTEITDTSLLGQLGTLTEAYSYNDATNLRSTSEYLPIIISVAAIKTDKAIIINSGNTTAKPILTIYGSGDIGVYLNGLQIFTVALDNEGYITIDTDKMEAYKDTPDNLKNRLVDGDFTNFVLPQGESQISFSGLVDRCVIENYSRWL